MYIRYLFVSITDCNSFTLSVALIHNYAHGLQNRQPHEQTDSRLSSRSSRSPSRHQRAADPRRESTVLFKGFSVSTAESGLLEVDEIAHINGSPELVKDSHPNTSHPHAQDAAPPAMQQSDPMPQATASDHQADSDSFQQEQLHQHHHDHQLQQQHHGRKHLDSLPSESQRPLATADGHKNTDTRAESSSEPALGHVHSSSRLQPVQAMSSSLAASAAEPTTVEGDRGVPEHNVPLPKQVRRLLCFCCIVHVLDLCFSAQQDNAA